MNNQQQQIVALARSQLGVPFVHQGRQPGVGLDCVGLIRYPFVELGLLPETADHDGYGREPVPSKMREQLLRWFDLVEPMTAAQPGDVLWLRMAEPQHLAVLTDTGSIIHAVSSGPKRVVEHRLSLAWLGRVHAVLRVRT